MSQLRNMRSDFMLIVLLLGLLAPATARAEKTDLYESIQSRDDEMWQAACQIWEWAEPGYQEHKSSKLLQEMLDKAGFKIEAGVAEIPTAFTATFGSGKPVIAILGEYDALPGLSQNSSPVRDPRVAGGYGHGCGHHLFGVASASAAISIAEQIRQGNLQGTVRFYGCPAEEGGSAKVFLVLAGLFSDCDAALHWHPGDRNAAGDRSSLARMAVKFRFHGKSAHAAGAPDQGRSALDAVELTNHASQLLREHVPDATRIHHVITSGGGAPNVVPDFAEVYYYVRHPKSEIVRDVYRRLTLCAQAGALATETELKIGFEGGIKEILPNQTLAKVTLDNLRRLNDLSVSEESLEFATRLQQSIDKPKPLDSVKEVEQRTGGAGMGSTDVGDVSWVVPTCGFNTACFVPGVPGHSWQAVASGRSQFGRNGMNLAAKVLAATAWDLYKNPSTLRAAKEELQKRLGQEKYQTLMQPGQKPPLGYRNAPSGGVTE
jgi:aminobenzoyl-glutamate utilization protein B